MENLSQSHTNPFIFKLIMLIRFVNFHKLILYIPTVHLEYALHQINLEIKKTTSLTLALYF